MGITWPYRGNSQPPMALCLPPSLQPVWDLGCHNGWGVTTLGTGMLNSLQQAGSFTAQCQGCPHAHEVPVLCAVIMRRAQEGEFSSRRWELMEAGRQAGRLHRAPGVPGGRVWEGSSGPSGLRGRPYPACTAASWQTSAVPASLCIGSNSQQPRPSKQTRLRRRKSRMFPVLKEYADAD